MERDKIAQALARIEAAASRMEKAAANFPASSPQAEARFLRLREESAKALADIDRLIGSLET